MCGCMVGVDDDVVVGCGFGNDCGGGVGCVQCQWCVEQWGVCEYVCGGVYEWVKVLEGLVCYCCC